MPGMRLRSTPAPGESMRCLKLTVNCGVALPPSSVTIPVARSMCVTSPFSTSAPRQIMRMGFTTCCAESDPPTTSGSMGWKTMWFSFAMTTTRSPVPSVRASNSRAQYTPANPPPMMATSNCRSGGLVMRSACVQKASHVDGKVLSSQCSVLSHEPPGKN